MKDPCIDDKDPDNPIIIIDLCWNGVPDVWETCDSCPVDFWWCVSSNECNSCPCEYVDFSTNLTRWDTLRAKLRDISRPVFYNYSNSVEVQKYLDIE